MAVSTINQDPPATCGGGVVAAVEGAVAELGYSSTQLVSRAYHDSLFMAQVGGWACGWVEWCRDGWSHPSPPSLHRPQPTPSQIAPTGMLFIPCRNGWSHRPDEYASPDDIERGVRVLALALARLAGEAAAAAAEHEEL